MFLLQAVRGYAAVECPACVAAANAARATESVGIDLAAEGVDASSAPSVRVLTDERVMSDDAEGSIEPKEEQGCGYDVYLCAGCGGSTCTFTKPQCALYTHAQ